MVANYHHGFNSQGVPGIIYWRGEEAVTNYLLMAPAAEVLVDKHDKEEDFVESMVIYTDNGFLERQRPVVLGRGHVSKTLFSFAQNRVGVRLQIEIYFDSFPCFCGSAETRHGI